MKMSLIIGTFLMSGVLVIAACAPNQTLPDPDEECRLKGGDWILFDDSCVDSCEKARNPEDIVCAQVQTMGCDCPEGMCWNGSTCIEI